MDTILARIDTEHLSLIGDGSGHMKTPPRIRAVSGDKSIIVTYDECENHRDFENLELEFGYAAPHYFAARKLAKQYGLLGKCGEIIKGPPVSGRRYAFLVLDRIAIDVPLSELSPEQRERLQIWADEQKFYDACAPLVTEDGIRIHMGGVVHVLRTVRPLLALHKDGAPRDLYWSIPVPPNDGEHSG